MNTTERELDVLIEDMHENLHSPHHSNVTRLGSRHYDYYKKQDSWIERTRGRSEDHKDIMYEKYGKYGGTWSPRSPRRSTLDEGWYKAISKDMGVPRTPTPILKRRSKYTQYEQENRCPTPVGRPLSAYSMDSYGSRSNSRTSSPVRQTKVSYSRSVSPSRSHVVIGPVTDFVTRREDGERKQEFFKGRDSRTGKPLPGRHGFMTTSWPYGLNHIGDEYEYGHSREPAEPAPYKLPPPVTPPLTRRARSVDPPTIERIPRLSYSLRSTPIPIEYMSGLKHIQVENVPVPVPPRFGTLTYGGRWPNEAMSPYRGGPPCQLCMKPITEGRCIYADNAQYHCWHFVCTFCSKIMKENDFVMAQDNKPYCINCFKREYP